MAFGGRRAQTASDFGWQEDVGCHEASLHL